MKTRYMALVVFIIGAASAITTGADDMRLRIHNATNLEMVWPTVYTETDGMISRIRSGFLSNVLPGMSVLISHTNAGKPVRMTVDMGLAAYAFDDLAPLGDLNGVEVTLGYDWEVYRPFLEKRGEGAVRLYGELTSTGWAAGDAAVVEFEGLLAATPAVLANMAVDERLEGTEEAVMPVAFAGGVWRCGWNPLYPEDVERLPAGEAVGPEGATLWAHCEEALLRRALDRLGALGYRPWSVMTEALEPGEAVPDLVGQVFQTDAARPANVAFMMWKKRPSRPGAVSALWTTELTRAEALEGEVVTRRPAFMVRVSNSALLEVSYYSDCRTLVALSRESLSGAADIQ